MYYKVCSACKEEKLLSEFNVDSRTKDKLTYQCKKCRGIQQASYYLNNKEHCARVDKEYALANKEKIRAKQRKYDSLNKDKRRIRDKKYIVVHKEQRRLRAIKRRHGLSKEDYFFLLKEQNNRCAICEKDFTLVKSTKNIHVDHDHRTGAVRAILCGKCNVALGHVDDSVTILEKMIAYLNKHGVSRLEGP